MPWHQPGAARERHISFSPAAWTASSGGRCYGFGQAIPRDWAVSSRRRWACLCANTETNFGWNAFCRCMGTAHGALWRGRCWKPALAARPSSTARFARPRHQPEPVSARWDSVGRKDLAAEWEAAQARSWL